jgi:hypothetical protein
MKDKQSITQIILKPNEELSINPKSIEVQPPFFKVGNGRTNKQGVSSMDLIDEMTKMSQPALKVIGWIKDGMVCDPFTESISFVVKIVPETSSDKRILKKGFKELQAKDIVRRVKRSHYMINPKAIIADYKNQVAVWDSLASTDKRSSSVSIDRGN